MKFPISKYVGKHPNGRWEFIKEFEGTYEEAMKEAGRLSVNENDLYRIWDREDVATTICPEDSGCICCPFCEEGDFDKVGLKKHIINGWCEIFNNTKLENFLDNAKSTGHLMKF